MLSMLARKHLVEELTPKKEYAPESCDGWKVSYLAQLHVDSFI
jgi:hypothetical protein